MISFKNNLFSKSSIIFIVLIITLFILVILATTLGTVKVPFHQTILIILKNLKLIDSENIPQNYESIIFFVRLPRVITAVLVGAALSVSGAVMQGIFRNPMADPSVLGISSGASLGAVIAIALFTSSAGIYTLPLFASIGALFVSVTIFLLSLKNSKNSTTTLILAGISIGSLLHSITSVILSFVSSYQVKEFVFWSLGSLSSRRWEHVQLTFIPIIFSILALMLFSKDLNVMILGDDESLALGLKANTTRKIMLSLTSVATASSVCITGNISFVGLIIPHILRHLIGPDYRKLLPASALSGAIFLVLCDLIGRLVSKNTEIGVGIITSMIGSPYFLYLLYSAKKDGISL
ncbi:MAG: iron ABC transporter permease [Clostridiales bacterium]